MSFETELFLIRCSVVVGCFLIFFVPASLLIDLKSGLIAGCVGGVYGFIRQLFW